MIPRERLEEIATKFKDLYLLAREDDPYEEVFEDMQEELDLSDEELEWLGIEVPDNF